MTKTVTDQAVLDYRREAIADALTERPAGSRISTDESQWFAHAFGHASPVCRNAWDRYVCEKHHGSLGYIFFLLRFTFRNECSRMGP